MANSMPDTEGDIFKSCKVSHHIYMNGISIVISIIRKIVYLVKALYEQKKT